MDAAASVSNGSFPSTSRMWHRLTATHRPSRYDTLPSEPGGGHHMIMRRALAAFALALIIGGPVWADGLPEELKARRERVMASLGGDTIAILWSAPERPYSRDVEYEYRQDSDLLYLTGITQPETILVLMPGNRTKREILFIRPADARREHWQGHQLTPAEATAQTGIATVYETPAFDQFFSTIMDGTPYGLQSREAALADTEHTAFFTALAAGTAKLAL